MGFMRAFWKAAIALDPKARSWARRGASRSARRTGGGAGAEAGWPAATVAPIEIETRFRSFKDDWQPFTLGAGPAPAIRQPADDKRAALKTWLKQDIGGDGRRASSRAHQR